MKIACIVRPDWKDIENLNRPLVGGGVMTKFLTLQKCCPNMIFTDSFDDPVLWTHDAAIVLVDPLVFHGNDSSKENLKKWKSYPGIRALWCEEQAIFRERSRMRDFILEYTDVLLACNEYQYQLLLTLNACHVPIYILPTPIDHALFHAKTKKKCQIIVAGKVGLQKNTLAIIELFKRLPNCLHKIYIGSTDLWGSTTYSYDSVLENELASVTDEYIPVLSPVATAERIRESWIAVNMSIYDVGSVFFLEAAMSGCHFFAWNYHPLFDEYNAVHRFDTVKQGAKCISSFVKNNQPAPDLELRTEVSSSHSFHAFHEHLKWLTGNWITTAKHRKREQNANARTSNDTAESTFLSKNTAETPQQKVKGSDA